MASRSSVAIKTKKAKGLAVKEANYIQMTGIMAEYQLGEVKPPKYRQQQVDYARRKLQFDKNMMILKEFQRVGIKVDEQLLCI